MVWTAGPGRETAACQWYWTAAAEVSSSRTTPRRFMAESGAEPSTGLAFIAVVSAAEVLIDVFNCTSE